MSSPPRRRWRGPLEHRRLLHREPDPQPDQHEHRGEQERDPPAPGQEVRLALHDRHHGEQAVGDQLARGRARLRPARPEAAPGRVAVLGDDQHRAAPLAAEREALDEPQHHQQHRGEHAHGRVGGQQPDRERREAHHQQAEHEQLLAADAVAVVAEHQAADGPGEEADRERAERGERGGRGVAGREEDVREDEGGGDAVEEEVVPLDGGARHAGGDDAHDVGARWCVCYLV